MMKLTLAALAFALSAPLQATPFLTSDPYPPSGPQPTEFLVSVDSAPDTVSPPVNRPGGKVLLHDLAGLTFGRHTVSVRARNATATSAPAALTFDLGIATPDGLIIVPVAP